MKSSSQYFPVSLMQTEFWDEFSEDVYLLKPNNSTDNTVEIAATRLYSEKLLNPDQPAMVFLHDVYQNHAYWLNKFESLLKKLMNSGADIWLVEMRGHGFSVKNRQYLNNTLEDFARYDLPAVDQFVREKHPGKIDWVGEGEGGIAVLRAAEAGLIDVEHIHRISLLKMARFKWFKRYWIPMLSVFQRLTMRKRYVERVGCPEPEFRSVWKQMVREKGLFGIRKPLSGGGRLFKKIRSMGLPLVLWSVSADKPELNLGETATARPREEFENMLLSNWRVYSD